jgi:hypothetical protein
MASLILMDEFQLAFRAPQGLPQHEYRVITRTLNSKRFQSQLRQAVRDVVRRHVSLGECRVTLAR